MNFNSVGSSNGAKYAAAGKAVANSAANVFDVQRKTGPDYAGLSQAAMKAKRDEKIAGIKAAQKVTQVGIAEVGNVQTAKNKIEGLTKSADIKRDSRKAGLLGAVGKMVGAGYLASRDNTKGRERPKADYSSINDGYKQKRDALMADYDNRIASTDTVAVSPGKATEGGTSNTSQGLSGTELSGDGFDMSKLTNKDFDDLAFAISSEAQLGTDDEYGVGANILTRLQSGNYGSSVNAIINAPGQYEGVYTGRSVASPEISARLQSPEGRQKLQEAMQRLDGRTEFKGQTMLQNRVAAEDPMFSSGGNFYHYAGQ